MASNYEIEKREVEPGHRARVAIQKGGEKQLPLVKGRARQKIEERVKSNGEIYDAEENQAQIAKALNLILDHLINGTSLTDSAELKEYLQTQEVAHTAYDEEGFAHQLSLVQSLLSQMSA